MGEKGQQDRKRQHGHDASRMRRSEAGTRLIRRGWAQHCLTAVGRELALGGPLPGLKPDTSLEPAATSIGRLNSTDAPQASGSQ